MPVPSPDPSWLNDHASLTAIIVAMLTLVGTLFTVYGRKRKKEPESLAKQVLNKLNMEGAKVSGSAVAVGSGITQTVTNNYIPPKPRFEVFGISVQEIQEHSERLTPYEKAHPVKVFEGVEVGWILFFSAMVRPANDEKYDSRLIFKSQRSLGLFSVLCDICIENEPRFKSLHSGVRVGVRGKIEYVGNYVIMLGNPKFTFLEKETGDD